jgi:hypothetical protein
MVANEEFVFLRSDVGMGGDSTFCFELFRDSHAKGPVSFRVGAEGGGRELCFSCAGGADGGGGNLTGDIFPERPCKPSPVLEWFRGGSFGKGPGSFSFSGVS